MAKPTKTGKEDYLRTALRFGRHRWSYRVFSVTEDLGEGRYRCKGEAGDEFGLYSAGMASDLKAGARLFLNVLFGVRDDWFMSYSPQLGWHGLFEGDFIYFAQRLAPQSYGAGGLDAVIRMNPVPFLAAFRFGNSPPVYHQGEPVMECWLHGKLLPGFEERLPSTWTRRDVGRRTRWM